MRFLIAPDSFKESMAAADAASAIQSAVLSVIPEAITDLLPVGDGGEGTLEALVHATGGTRHYLTVTGPLGEPVEACFGMLGDGVTAVVEMAQASGLQLVAPRQRNPLKTTTYGTGELILAALDYPLERLIVMIGGSATNDGGAGMLQALGASLSDSQGQAIGYGGGALRDLKKADFSSLDSRLSALSIRVACDVNNPLLGERGASHVFGPQKGATADRIELLEAGMRHYSEVLSESTGQSIDVPGAGAAGGLGGALLLCGGTLMSGIDIVLDTLGFDDKLAAADYVITGEGRIDDQTPDGKVIAGIARRAGAAGVPVLAFAGSVKPGYEDLYALAKLSVHSITPYPCTLEEALRSGKSNLMHAAQNIIRLLQFTKP
ncbi:glycerate kinase [Paenibacillus solisilvae]|uniref:Glycerate kinase n=1 Tax=Paenibacillus solisilvae TaxID=2486751 RepID=A0ABW0W059_9BACL